MITALNRNWHPEHFLCELCDKRVGEDGYHEKDGYAYCRWDSIDSIDARIEESFSRECYMNNFVPKCLGCKQIIVDTYIQALGGHYHKNCFVCQVKNICRYWRLINWELISRNVYNLFSQVHSMNTIINHYANCIIINDVVHFVRHVKNLLGTKHQNVSNLKFSNSLVFSGRCITAMGRKYHVEHFICSYCTRQLQNGTFKEYQNKPYCHPCFVKLFAWTFFIHRHIYIYNLKC